MSRVTYTTEAPREGGALPPEFLMELKKLEAERRMASYDALSPSTRNLLKEHAHDPRPFGTL